jgi:phytoene dehydrogenase-like protein
MVQLAIRMDLPRSLDCGHLLFLPRFGASADYFALANRGLIETNGERLGFALGFPTLKDPSLAPPDHHILSIIHMPASPRVFEDHRSADPESYVAAKKSIAGSLIAAAERLIPGLSKSIVDMDVITPRTLERYTGATGGCWYDVAETPAQLTMRRRFAYPAIENLYLTGAKTVFGPALYGAILGGLDTADAILGRKLWEQVFRG